MDKKNLILGLICIAAAFGVMYMSANDQKRMADYRKAHPELFPVASGNTTGNQTSGNATTTPAESPQFPVVENTAGNATATSTATPTGEVAAPAPAEGAPSVPEEVFELSNDDITVALTSAGGAIKSVALKKFPLHPHAADPVIFNADAPLPMLALALPRAVKPDASPETFWTMSGGSVVAASGHPGVPPLPLLQHFTLDKAASNTTTATFHGTLQGGLEITRTYSLSADPYGIEHKTVIANRGAAPVSLQRLFITLGAAPPTPNANYIVKQSLNFGYYDGERARFLRVTEFEDVKPSWFGVFSGRPKRDFVYAPREGEPGLRWVSVKDQFFAAVLTPQNVQGDGFFTSGLSLPVDGGNMETTVTGDMEMNLGVLSPNAEKSAEFNFYVGPKEYIRLDRLGQRQDLVMEFGWFGGISKLLLLAIMALHKAIVPLSPNWSWGWAIVIFTIIIKLMTWPLTAVQVRSAKRMGLIQKPLAALKEKYKDNPQKLQTEMMELFKKNKINPAAGCLPMFIQIPIFISFYYMLRTASELRFASFLWIKDLSQPDTIGHIAGVPFNLLPIFMTATMMIQMHMTPSPTTDNTQKRVMQFMPLLFFFSFYTMPAGMILYWTCQNLFTIFQQYLTNRKKDDPAAEPAPAGARSGGKRR